MEEKHGFSVVIIIVTNTNTMAILDKMVNGEYIVITVSRHGDTLGWLMQANMGTLWLFRVMSTL